MLAFKIPAECMVSRVIDRKGHSKVHVADCVEQHFGVRSYLAVFGYGEEEDSYLVLADMTCLMEVVDPEEKKEPEQEVRPEVKEKKPKPTIKEAVYETIKDVCPQREARTETPEWVMPLTCGVLLGFIAGTAFTRAAQEHPVMTAAVLPVGAAALITAWIYSHADKGN